MSKHRRRNTIGHLSPALALGLATLLPACGPGTTEEPPPGLDPPSVYAQGVTAIDADGNTIGVAVDIDTHWATIFHEASNAVFRLNLTTGNVAGPGRQLTALLQENVTFLDYFYSEGGCGEDLWRHATNNPSCAAPAVYEAVAVGADAGGWEEGGSVWVSGETASESVSVVHYVIADDNGDPLCGDPVPLGEAALCDAVQAAFEGARDLCMDNSSTYDVWFSDSACDNANEDGYDNTEFYECLVTKFTNPDPQHTCETDAEGNPTAIRQFEDTSESSDPPGCRELYQNSPTDNGPPGGMQPTASLGQEVCAYKAAPTDQIPTSFAAPIQLAND